MARAYEGRVGGASAVEQSEDGPAPVPGKTTLSDTADSDAAPGIRPLPRLQLGNGAATGLPTSQRAQFERSLNTDLSDVRVHTGQAADGAAKEHGARAFAVGQDIVFGAAQYQPGTREGDRLLAHEVAHTVQQSGASSSGNVTTTQRGDGVERDADVAASAMVSGQAAAVSPAPIAIARKGLDEDVSSEPTGGAPEGKNAGEGTESKEGAGEIGELSAERVGQEEEEGTEPISPIPNTEAGKAEIASSAGQLPPEGGAEELAGGAPQVEAGGGGGGDGDEVVLSAELQQSIGEAQADAKEASAQAQAEATAFKAEMAEQRDRFEAQQNALTLEQLNGMSSADKRATLVEMGYDQKSVKKMKDAELEGIISGRIATEQRKTKILGMDPEELAAQSPAAKAQFLVDLGIDKKDVDKIGVAAAARAFDDVMRVAHVPGQHKVKIKVKGGLLGKSWEVSVKVDAEGNPELEAKKKGGFLSKLWGWVKLALPIIALVLVPVTAGASLIVLAVYQTVTAIAAGDWLGAIVGAAGAMVGLGALAGIGKTAQGAATAFGKIANVAGKVQKVAQAAQASMAAAKAKNAGGLLAALSSGAGAFASFAGNQAGKFATTMKKWSDKLDRWAKIISGGEKVAKGIKTGNVGTALAGAFDAAAAGVSKKDDKGQETSSKAKDFTRYARMASFAAVGQAAATKDPPGYGQIVEAAMGISGELKLFNKDGNAAKITAAATRLSIAIASKDPAQLTAAALGLAETIHMAKFNADGDDVEGGGKKEDKEALAEKYAKANRVVNVAAQAIAAASKKPRPDYASALDAAAQLVAEFTEDKRLDAAAQVTAKMDVWTKAIQSKDPMAIAAAGVAFGEAINGLRTSINDERAKSKAAAEAKLGPGETLPEPATTEVPPFTAGPPAPDLLPSTPLDFGLLDEMPAIEPSMPAPTAPGPRPAPIDPRARANTPNANYTVIQNDTLSGIARTYSTSLNNLRTLNPQIVESQIYVGQRLRVPGATASVSTSETYDLDGVNAADARAKVMDSARRMVEDVKFFIKLFRDAAKGSSFFMPGLGGAFVGSLLDLERFSARLGTYVDNPGIGTNVVQRERDLVSGELEKVKRNFDRLNAQRNAVLDWGIVAATIVRDGGGIVLQVLDRTRVISSLYTAATSAIDAYASGSGGGMALVTGAAKGALEKFAVLPNSRHATTLVTSAINDAFRLMGDNAADFLAFANRRPRPTEAEVREYAKKQAMKAAFSTAFSPLRALPGGLEESGELTATAASAFVAMLEKAVTVVIDQYKQEAKK